jgi:2-keto-4-pentenoate hydratase/2-oxohepta-3-ene-1,7-dioic acid hydratase in catechol pathway
MRLATVEVDGRKFVAARTERGLIDLSRAAPELPTDLVEILRSGDVARTLIEEAIVEPSADTVVDPRRARLLPVVPSPGKIICAGLNYRDHSTESGFQQPSYPALFARFASSLIGDGAPIVLPEISHQLDYEGEIAVIIGRRGRSISSARALDFVAGYAVFNDASIRDYQTKTTQWTVGKNFDDTGAFGPDFVSADELPPGLAGLRLTTRLNGQVVQSASADDMVFSVAELIAIISEAITLDVGDVIVTGTPAGVGLARKPPLWMKAGDVIEVEVERIGVLRNPVIEQKARANAA